MVQWKEHRTWCSLDPFDKCCVTFPVMSISIHLWGRGQQTKEMMKFTPSLVSQWVHWAPHRKECFQMHHQNPPCQRENYSEGLNYWSSLSTSTLVTENLLQVIIHSVYRLKGCLSLPYANWPDLRNTSCRWALLLWVKRKQPQNKSTCLLGLSRFTTGFQLLSCFKLGISIKHLFKWKKMYMHICAATLTVLREYTLSSLTFTNHSCFHIRPTIPPQKSAFTYFFLSYFSNIFISKVPKPVQDLDVSNLHAL